MHAVVRLYTGQGAQPLFQMLEDKRELVKGAIARTPGLSRYTLIRTRHGGASLTVCRTPNGTDESTRIARRFIAAHAPHLDLAAPNVAEGAVILDLDLAHLD
ncbi:MAG: hypothetical protein AAF899_04330 [Pseudomonadota bacterium]